MRSVLFVLALAGCTATVHAPDEKPLPLPRVIATATPPPAEQTPPPPAMAAHTSREWLALAEEAFAHDRLVEAARYYDLVTRSDDALAPYAWYKLAFLRWNQNDGQESLAAFVHAIHSASDHGDTKIASAASKDIVAVYAQYGRPTSAYDFFRSIGVSPLDAVQRLGAQYFDLGKWKDARAAYAELVAHDPAHACGYRVRDKAADDASRGSPIATRAELDARVAQCP